MDESAAEAGDSDQERLDFGYIVDTIRLKAKNVAKRSPLGELCIVLGNTGSGKSSTINYLLGNEMRFVYDAVLKRKVLKGALELTEMPVIGHSIRKSTTFYPEVYRLEAAEAADDELTGSVAFCDYPGFENASARLEDRIVLSLITELYMESVSSVRAIIVVVSMADVHASKAEMFINLFDSLSDLFRDVERIKSSILFVVTRAYNEEDLAAICHELIEQLSEEARDEQAGEQARRRAKSLKMLQMIAECRENIVTLDPLTPASRADILARLGRLGSPLGVDAFNFDQFDRYRARFNRRLVEHAKEMLGHFERLGKLTEELARLREERQTFTNQIEATNVAIEGLTSSLVDDNSLKQELAELRTRALELERGLSSREAENAKLMTELEKLRADEAEYEVVECYKVFVTEFSASSSGDPEEFKTIPNEFKLTKMKRVYQIDYEDIPFNNMKIARKNGSLVFDVCEPHAGRLRGRFEADIFMKSSLQIEIHVKKSGHPKYAKQYAELRNRLDELAESREFLLEYVKSERQSLDECRAGMGRCELKIRENEQLRHRIEASTCEIKTLISKLKSADAGQEELKAEYEEIVETRVNPNRDLIRLIELAAFRRHLKHLTEQQTVSGDGEDESVAELAKRFAEMVKKFDKLLN